MVASVACVLVLCLCLFACLLVRLHACLSGRVYVCFVACAFGCVMLSLFDCSCTFIPGDLYKKESISNYFFHEKTYVGTMVWKKILCKKKAFGKNKFESPCAHVVRIVLRRICSGEKNPNGPFFRQPRLYKKKGMKMFKNPMFYCTLPKKTCKDTIPAYFFGTENKMELFGFYMVRPTLNVPACLYA